SLRDCGRGRFERLDIISGRETILCVDGDRIALHFGPSGQMRWTATAHQGGLRAFAYDRDAKRLFTIGADARLKIWDAAPRSVGVARSAADLRLIRGDGGRILALTETGAARKLGADGAPLGPPIAQPHKGAATVVPLTDDLVGFFTYRRPGFGEVDGAGAVNRFSIFDAASGEAIAEYAGLRSADGANLAVSADRARFLMRLVDGGVILGDGTTGAAIETIRLDGDQPIFGAAIGGPPDARRLAFIASNGEAEDPDARVMRLFAGPEGGAPVLIGEWKAQAAQLSLSEDGARALIALRKMPWEGAEIVLVDLADIDEGAVQRSLATSARDFAWVGLSPGARYAHFAPDGDAVAADGAPLAAPVVIDLETGAETIAPPPIQPLDPDPVWSPDGSILAHLGPPLRLFAAATGAEICTGLADGAVDRAVFAPNADRIAIQRAWRDGGAGAEVHDLTTCAPLRRIGGETGFADPLFIDDERLWLPLPGEIAEAPLAVDFARALASVRSRASRLSDE
ncbi:MAG: WD40 repeat domain-containing protein, partial [Pseudomonadota bacterium]